MKVKNKFLTLTNDILGKEDVFSLVQAEDYNGYNDEKKESTGKRAGTRFTVLITNAEREIHFEKLDIKIAGDNPIPQYKSGETADCKVINLKLKIIGIEYGKAEINATADGIELLTTNEQEEPPIAGQLKIKL